MSNLEKKEPGERNENSEVGQGNLPEALRPNKQQLIHLLEVEQAQLNNAIKTGRKDVAEALQKNIEQLSGQIDKLIYEETKTERKRLVVENFGQETLDSAELFTKGMGTVIENHLLSAKDRKEAERILALWDEFAEAMSFTADSQGKPKRAEKVLEEAIETLRPGKQK